MSRNYRPPWRERLADRWERLWWCIVHNTHQVKFGTAPRCYRCGKIVGKL